MCIRDRGRVLQISVGLILYGTHNGRYHLLLAGDHAGQIYGILIRLALEGCIHKLAGILAAEQQQRTFLQNCLLYTSRCV